MASDNLIRNLAYWARVQPDKTAINCDGIALSYADLERRSNELAAGFARLGISKGDTVGLMMRSRTEFAECLYATFKAGAAVVLLNIRSTANELQHPVQDAALSLIVADEEFLAALEQVPTYAPDVRIVTSVPAAGRESLDDLRIAGAWRPDILIEGSDIAFVCYTSGTTGVPKGAMLSHGSIFSSGAAKSYILIQSRLDRLMLPMPMAYTAGSVFFCRDGILPGATTYFLSHPDPDQIFDAIEQEKLTAIESVSVLFERMLEHPRFKTTDFSSLKRCSTGGARVSQHLLESWQARGVELAQAYGQTESAGGPITVLPVEDAVRKLGFAGRPMPNLDVIIVDEAGNQVAANTPGEIWVRGSGIMSGYLNRPEETAKALAGGWLHTGDVGLMDEEGYIKIVDRTKDMLISGGLNVYPAEIEKVLHGVPGLDEFAVIGVPDSRWGEVPMIVTPDAAAVDVPALLARAKSELADYKRPRYLAGYGEPLPRTFSGKLTKPEIRARFPTAPDAAIALK